MVGHYFDGCVLVLVVIVRRARFPSFVQQAACTSKYLQLSSLLSSIFVILKPQQPATDGLPPSNYQAPVYEYKHSVSPTVTMLHPPQGYTNHRHHPTSLTGLFQSIGMIWSVYNNSNVYRSRASIDTAHTSPLRRMIQTPYDIHNLSSTIVTCTYITFTRQMLVRTPLYFLDFPPAKPRKNTQSTFSYLRRRVVLTFEISYRPIQPVATSLGDLKNLPHNLRHPSLRELISFGAKEDAKVAWDDEFDGVLLGKTGHECILQLIDH